MKILRELLAIQKPQSFLAEEKEVELSDIIEYFPTQHKNAIQQLWGTDRLTWHGKKFFSGDELGDAYEEIEGAAKAILPDVEVDAQLTIEPVYKSGVQEMDFDPESLEWKVKFEKDDVQEVYLGYDPKSDKMYIGFDAWADEAAFNEEMETSFEAITGEEYDYENEAHAAVFQKAWDNYQKAKMGMWGIVFEVTYDDGDMSAEEMPQLTAAGGFYGSDSTYKQLKRAIPSLVDIRLD